MNSITSQRQSGLQLNPISSSRPGFTGLSASTSSPLARSRTRRWLRSFTYAIFFPSGEILGCEYSCPSSPSTRVSSIAVALGKLGSSLRAIVALYIALRPLRSEV